MITKKRLGFLAILLMAVLLYSCQRGERPQSSQRIDPAVVEAEAIAGGLAAGYVLRVNSGIYALDTDTGQETDVLRWAAGMSLGERVYAGEIRRATFQERVYEFVKIRRENGTEGYAFTTQVAVGGQLAVVTDDRAILHRGPRTIDVSNVILTRRTVVVFYPETESGGYVEVRGFDIGRNTTIAAGNNFVRLNTLSRQEADIQSSILLQTALALTRPEDNVRKEALLESALLDYPNSIFYSEINEIVNPSNFKIVATEPLESRVTMWVTNDNVNIRDIPDIEIGRAIGSLNGLDEVSAFEQTMGIYTINEQQARWYKVTTASNIEGWVFGAFLTDDHGTIQ